MNAAPSPARSYEAFRGTQPEALSNLEAEAAALRMGLPLGTSAEMWLAVRTNRDLWKAQ